MSTRAQMHERAPLPKPGTEVWLEDLVGGPWSAEVLAHEGDLVRISAPRIGHQRVVFPLEEAFTLTYRLHEVPCEAPAMLVESPGGIPLRGDYLVRLTAPPLRLQRRGAVRVPVQLIVRAEARDIREVDAASIISGTTENLSADGALVRLEHPLAIGDLIEVAVQCGGAAGTVNAVGSVVRCDRQGTRSRPWRVALAFREIEPRDQERLIRHLFERQRDLRRREIEESR